MPPGRSRRTPARGRARTRRRGGPSPAARPPLPDPAASQGPALPARLVPVIPPVHPLGEALVVPAVVDGGADGSRRGDARLLGRGHLAAPVPLGVEHHQVPRVAADPLDDRVETLASLGEPPELALLHAEGRVTERRPLCKAAS